MALGLALLTAKNSLKTTSGQLNTVSRNIAGARDPDYTRRTTHLQTGLHGCVSATVLRDGNQQLLNTYITKSSHSAAATTIANGANRLSDIYGSDDYSNSPGRLLADFHEALQTYANQPAQRSAGDAAVDRARDLAHALNHGNKEIETLRHDADGDIKASVDHVNELLDKFHDLDRSVFSESHAGRDAYGYMDQRDAVLKELSQEIGISTVSHSDGTTTIYGMDGSTLYDRQPRQVTFQPSAALPAGAVGGAVYVDGVPLGHSSFSDPNGGGHIGGLLKVRDDIAPQYQKHLDETASALMDMFKGPPSLFLDKGNGSVTGLSGRIELNPAFDSNTANGGPENFGDHLQELVDGFDSNRIFSSGTGLSEDQSILSFAKHSTSWLESTKKNTTETAQYKNTQLMRAGEALSNDTGVNTDDEMALMLQLEQTYSASARIMTSVQKMLDDLMSAIG